MAHMTQGVMKDLRPLPPGWQQHWSQEMNKWYYVQMSTVPPRVTYDHPLDLPHLALSPPPPPPPTYLESQYPQRPPSRGSVASGVSSLSSPSISSRGSVIMTVERAPKNNVRHLTPAQAIAQAHSNATRRNMAVPPNQAPHPLPHPQPVQANTLHGPPVGQRPQVHTNPMAKMPEPQPNGFVNPSGMYKVGYTSPVPGAPPQSNPSMLSVSSNSTTMSGANSVAPLKGKGEIERSKPKEKRPKNPKKRSFFGTSAMEDLREEHKAAIVTTTTMPVGLPNMGPSGQVQMGAVNTVVPGQAPVLQQNTAFGIQGGILMNGQMGMQNQSSISPGQVPVLQQDGTFGMQGGVPMNTLMGMQNQPSMLPGQVPAFQQNTAFGMQGNIPLNAQMGMQNRPLPQPTIDISRVTNVAKNALSSALYVTTGITSQDFVKLGSRIKVAFSGVPLNEIGISARDLESVLAGQPGANYQGVINALMLQQQREYILMHQTGRPSSKVNYQELINQVHKMQDIANNKMQSMMAMNAGMGGMQMGMNGMVGVQGQGMIAQQNAVLQQQNLMEQQRLAQMQMSMGQVPGQVQVPMGQAPAQMQMAMGQAPTQMQMAMGQVPGQMQVPMGQVPVQMQMSTVQAPMMVGQQQMGLQTQTTGVANPMMQAQSMRMQSGIATKGKKVQQVTRPGTTTQGKKKEKPLPVAPEGKKKKKIQQAPAVPIAPEGKKKSVQQKRVVPVVVPTIPEGKTRVKAQQTRALPTAMPVAPEGKKKRVQQTQARPTATRPNVGRENRIGRASVGSAPQMGKVQQQRVQQQTGVAARGRGPQGNRRGGSQRQLGYGAQGQPGQVVQGGDNEPDGFYLIMDQQDADEGDNNEDGDGDGNNDDDDDEGDDNDDDDDDEGDDGDEDDGNGDEDAEIDVTVYEDDNDNDEDEDEEEIDVEDDVAVYEDDDDEEEPEEEEPEVEVDGTVYENEDEDEGGEEELEDDVDGPISEEEVVWVEEDDDQANVAVYEVTDPCVEYQVYDVDPYAQYQVYDVDQGGNSGGFDLSASFGDLNLDGSYGS